MSYKLRCSVVGHEKDVRSLSSSHFPEGSFVSGSRDVTARLWTPNEQDLGFTEGLCMGGHSGYVTSVCVIPPDDNYPQGLIMTGSQDNMIFAYQLESPEPVFRLTGHEDTVCALAAGKFGTLLSGSWDKTAKVWLNQKCVMTLEGHKAAVWAVAMVPEGGFMLTGSADKSICLWRAGKCELRFLGHTDCVRGLAVLSATEFISCSNDATVRRWSMSGPCTHTYHGHTNFVYSLAILANGQDFVSTSEDRTLRVWRDGECEQTITHPTQSVWSVCCLSNGDIVTGSSDGVIRVFSCEEDRMADSDLQKTYEDQVASSGIPSQVGDLKKEDLPGPDVLLQPGKKDGQTIMVLEEGKVVAHQWNSKEFRWVQVGEVVGASGTTAATSGKTLYEGKEYDYVFTVDIEEGKPPLKLPYNLLEDPWLAAQNFLHRHELNQTFLDQVANFIVENTKSAQICQVPQSGFQDPFTGGTRYVPGSQPGTAGGVSRGGADPFTGQGRYVPPTTRTQQSTNLGGGPDKESSKANQYFPKFSYLSFDQANVEAILGKLKAFNKTLDGSVQEEESALNDLQPLILGESPSTKQIQLLQKLLQWPIDKVFPVLDILRLAMRSKAVNEYFCCENNGKDFLIHLMNISRPDSPVANQMLSLRVLANTFKSSAGEKLMAAAQIEIIASSLVCKDSATKNIHISLSTLLLNYAIYLYHHGNMEYKSQCLSAAAEVSKVVTDPEANFRLLICIGTLVWGDNGCKTLAKSLGILQYVKNQASVSDPPKVTECAQLLAKVLY